MADELPIDDEHLIEDPDTLKVLGDPLRIKILGQVAQMNEAGQLATAKELAESLDVPQTKLYYHLNLLGKHGLLRVAETELVSGILEKRYQIRARRLRADVHIEPSLEIDSADDIETIMAPLISILDNTLHNLKRSVQAELARLKNGQPPDMDQIHVQQKALHLTDEQAHKLIQQLEKIISDYSQPSGGKGDHYHLTTLFHPGQSSKSDSQEP